MNEMGLIARARLRWQADFARRARARKDRAACRRSILAVLAVAFGQARAAPAAGGVPIGPIRDCEPVMNSQGGFFSCIAIADSGARYFVKGMETDDREVAFWRAWQRGAVRTGGRHYRIVPPVAMLGGRHVSILVFPELEFIARLHEQREELFIRNVDLVVRAIADFNSDHLAPAEGLLPAPRACSSPPPPARPRTERILGIDAAEAEALVATLRGIDARWSEVRQRLYAGPDCLCHMDAGIGNITVHDGVGFIQDFGCACLEPVGSDLHTIFRYMAGSGEGWTERDRLVATYAEVFAEKGIDVDPGAVRLALDAHFAARYRSVRPRSRSNRPVFDEAIRTSLALLEDGRTHG